VTDEQLHVALLSAQYTSALEGSACLDVLSLGQLCPPTCDDPVHLPLFLCLADLDDDAPPWPMGGALERVALEASASVQLSFPAIGTSINFSIHDA
jgi:hypothetical protein